MIEVALDVWWEGIPGEAEGKGVHVPGVWGKERRPVPPGTPSLPFFPLLLAEGFVLGALGMGAVPLGVKE